jgi:hypothetical protein
MTPEELTPPAELRQPQRDRSHPPELSHRRRMLVLAICCMSLFIVGLDRSATVF